jgi:hypothetical protein
LPPELLENQLRATIRSIDLRLPPAQMQGMEQAVSGAEAPRRFNTVLISSFEAVALLLAVLGIYSVIAFTVVMRAQEMAIRMALGSDPLVLTLAACTVLILCDGRFPAAGTARRSDQPHRGIARGMTPLISRPSFPSLRL